MVVGRSRGFGFLSFNSKTNAENALATMSSFKINGRTIKVDIVYSDILNDFERLKSLNKTVHTASDSSDKNNLSAKQSERTQVNPSNSLSSIYYPNKSTDIHSDNQ